MTLAPCLDCGEPVVGSRCRECSLETERTYVRTPKTSARARGYTTAWDRLSRRARRLQPWCSDCGATDQLQTDHSPEAWDRYFAGVPIRLVDVDVVCATCNVERGTARPGGMRSTDPPGTLVGQAKSESHSTGELLPPDQPGADGNECPSQDGQADSLILSSGVSTPTGSSRVCVEGLSVIDSLLERPNDCLDGGADGDEERGKLRASVEDLHSRSLP